MFCERRPRRQHRIRPPNSHLATGYLQAYAAAIVTEPVVLLTLERLRRAMDGA